MKKILSAVILLSAFISSNAYAEQPGMVDINPDNLDKEVLPLYEIGLGAGWASIPHYPASDDSNEYYFPFPYFVYRGNVLRADRQGVRALFYETPDMEVNFSFDGTPPVDSSKDDARRGMDNMDALLEVGPAVRYKLWDDFGQNLSVNVPVRFATAVGGHGLEYEGILFNPQLRYSNNRVYDKNTRFVATLGPKFAYNGLNDFYYTVEPQFQTATRPTYFAEDGYIGTEASFGSFYSFLPDVNLFFGASFTYNGGNINENSPLYRQDYDYRLATGFIYSLYKSEEKNVVPK